MALLFLTDIHADIDALNAILNLVYHPDFYNMYGRIQWVYNLGDVVSVGLHPHECIARLKSIVNIVSVKGNHDEGYEFFNGMPVKYLDWKNRVYIAHGGIIDPIDTPSTVDSRWRSEMWQRLSFTKNAEHTYAPEYYYTPKMAFDAARKKLRENNFTITCGHSHNEAAFEEYRQQITNLIDTADSHVQVGGVTVRTKSFPLRSGANYLFIVGAVCRDDCDRVHFGLKRENEFTLFEFTPLSTYTSWVNSRASRY